MSRGRISRWIRRQARVAGDLRSTAIEPAPVDRDTRVVAPVKLHPKPRPRAPVREGRGALRRPNIVQCLSAKGELECRGELPGAPPQIRQVGLLAADLGSDQRPGNLEPSGGCGRQRLATQPGVVQSGTRVMLRVSRTSADDTTRPPPYRSMGTNCSARRAPLALGPCPLVLVGRVPMWRARPSRARRVQSGGVGSAAANRH